MDLPLTVKEVSDVLSNLKAEMARASVTVPDIAEVVKRSDRTVRERIKGNGYFSMPDAMAVRDAFFPGMALEYLFAHAAQDSA